MKKIVLFLIIIALIGGGLFYYFKIYKAEEGANKENLFVFENKDEKLTLDIVERFRQQFMEAVAEIENSPNAGLGWAVAGNIKKAVNDYQGAEELYLEGLKNVPKSDVLCSNLGDLYYHFIEDYEKAEKYYLAAVELKPTVLANYLELAIMYRVRLKDKEKAINILKTGLENNPESKELLIGLASAYKKYNMMAEAKEIWQGLVEKYPENENYRKELEFF